MKVFAPGMGFSRIAAQAGLAAALLLLTACGGGGGSGGGGASTATPIPTTPAPGPPTATATGVTATTADISVPSDTAGTAYVIFLPKGTAAPTAAAIKVASAGSGDGVIAERMAVTADAPATVSLMDLEEGTEYEAYVVVESDAGGFGSIMKVDVATPPAPPPAPPPALARPDLANASTATLVAGTEITTISFTNNGGGALTGCTVSPTLPTGLEVSRSTGNASCQITGTPRVVSSQTTYTVTATNATGADTTPATVAITVAPARPDLANAPAASLTAGTRASTILFTNNGGGALTGCTVSPTLPTGLNVSRSTGNASCEIIGTPASRQRSDHLQGDRHQRHGRGLHPRPLSPSLSHRRGPTLPMPLPSASLLDSEPIPSRSPTTAAVC